MVLESEPTIFRGFWNDQWLVLDSSGIKDEDVGIDDVPQVAFTEEVAKKSMGGAVHPMGPKCVTASEGDVEENLPIVDGLMGLVNASKRHWIGTHRPMNAISYESVDSRPAALLAFQCELTNVVALANISVPDVAAVVSGHVHYFQLAQYQHGVSQVALGNGGTQLKTPLDGQPIGLDLVAGKQITVLDDLVVSSPTVGEWGYGILEANGVSAAAAPRLTAKFLSDGGFQGAQDVVADLPLRTWSVPGTGWRKAAA